MDLTMQSEEIEAFMCPPAMGRTQKHGCVLLRWEVSKGDTIAHGRDQKHGCRHAMRTNSTNGNVCTVHGSKRVLSHVCGRTRRRWCGAQVRPTAARNAHVAWRRRVLPTAVCYVRRKKRFVAIRPCWKPPGTKSGTSSKPTDSWWIRSRSKKNNATRGKPPRSSGTASHKRSSTNVETTNCT